MRLIKILLCALLLVAVCLSGVGMQQRQATGAAKARG